MYSIVHLSWCTRFLAGVFPSPSCDPGYTSPQNRKRINGRIFSLQVQGAITGISAGTKVLASFVVAMRNKGTIVRCERVTKSVERTHSWDPEGEAMLNASSSDSTATVSTPSGLCADLRWYAISTRSRHEKMVRDRRAGIGVEPFLPLTRTLSQWSDRKVWTESPLFSGYCFARFALTNSHAVLQTPGIVRIVGSVMPEPIPDEELEAIMKLAQSARSLERHDYLTEGTWVEVVRGPLTGLRGQLLRKASHDCLVIRVHLIQQAATVHIDMSEVILAQ